MGRSINLLFQARLWTALVFRAGPGRTLHTWDPKSWAGWAQLRGCPQLNSPSLPVTHQSKIHVFIVNVPWSPCFSTSPSKVEFSSLETALQTVVAEVEEQSLIHPQPLTAGFAEIFCTDAAKSSRTHLSRSFIEWCTYPRYSFLRDLFFLFLELLAPVALTGLAVCSVLPVATSRLWAYGPPC